MSNKFVERRGNTSTARVVEKPLDKLVAGHALATRSILVTANTADFAGAPGLAIENWITAT
jgi:predicted nucleic acid-binding protein